MNQKSMMIVAVLSLLSLHTAQAKLGDINASTKLGARGICIVLQGATAMVTIVHPVREPACLA